jgi:radical SAM protein with 4Fe4S-binding SPASM domain
MAHRAAAERIPLNGSIAMTHRCHLRCVHCYLGPERYAPPDGGERDTAFWLSVVDQIASAGCLTLLITGGEPLLRPDFAEVYARAKQRGLLVTVFTNATLVNREVLDLFDELPPQLVDVTLYGASAEVYDRVTGAPGAYARCLSGVDSLLERGIRVGLKAMILTDNQHEIPAMRQMAKDRGATFRVDPALFPRRDGSVDPLDHRVPPETAVTIEMEEEGLRERTATSYQKLRELAPADRLFGCGAGSTGFHVDPRGVLLPCLMVSTHGFDLRRGSFRQGWDEILPAFVEQAVPSGYECHECERRFLCGLCPAQFEMETGSLHVSSEYSCRLGTVRHEAVCDLRVLPPASIDEQPARPVTCRGGAEDEGSL